MERAVVNISRLFALDKEISEFEADFNSELIQQVSLFRDTYLELAALQPTLLVTFSYITKGERGNVHKKIQNMMSLLESTISGCFHGAVVNVELIGARELLSLARTKKSYTLQLKFKEALTAETGEAYALLVGMDEYLYFITDEEKELRRYVFESNVRDYQGQVEVNQAIQKTVESDDALDFWWLNNGITVIASKATITGKLVSLDDVRIVNGLQTTETISRYLNAESPSSQRRSVLVKILITTDAECIDRIIKATNFQTSIPVSSLRATHEVQRNIEEFFGIHGFYYDRRKNFYKNHGKPANKIITIPYLAQAVGALVLRQPHRARGKPSSLLKSDTDYARIFGKEIRLELYLACVKIMKLVDAYMKASVMSKDVRINFRYHIGMLALMVISGTSEYETSKIVQYSDLLTPIVLTKAVGKLADMLEIYESDENVNTIAKQGDFVNYLAKNLSFRDEDDENEGK